MGGAGKLEAKFEAKLEFPEGRGAKQNPSMQGVYFLELCIINFFSLQRTQHKLVKIKDYVGAFNRVTAAQCRGLSCDIEVTCSKP